MIRRAQRWRHWLIMGLGAGVAAFAVSACTVMQSHRVALIGDVPQPGSSFGCTSEGGAYALSMTTWSFEIARYGDGPYVLEQINTQRHPDQRWTFCLDYLAASSASDTLSIGYTDGTGDNAKIGAGLLSYVASFAIDKTGNAIRKIIRSIFVGLSQSVNFDPNRAAQTALTATRVKLGQFEVDPLNAEEMAGLNARLRDFGFCLVLDKYSFDTRAAPPETYCASPQAVMLAHPSPDLRMARRQQWLRPNPDRAGVLYRPRIPYLLSIYTKEDPTGSAPWLLRKTLTVELENLAPVVALGIDRALFAENKVGLEFNGGVLSNFCVARSSPVAGFINIPLDIVYGIVSLPAETIRAEVSRATETEALVAAEKSLIDAQQQYAQFLLEKGGPPQSNVSASVPNGAAGCQDGKNCPPATPDTKLNATNDAGAFLEIASAGICKQLTDKLASAAQ